ncbi:50S ribosomal protein L25 [Patescibacteria group bacterium]|nr:50S ribosomal protein L25 [Patescibacteria group bacterium]MBU4458774.1 50S ribosomal protein L25 [Patescibacteria group bacterium]MCG2696192.1 50S ribosomal protein L25 [Candidatus Portnoybacteria bacterium]
MELEIKAQQRERVGKDLQSLRKEGIIPAVVYGPGHKSISLQVNYEELKKVFEQAGESTLIKLKIGNEAKNVLIHDFAKDPITGRFIHVDFYHVRMDKVIKAEVPLIFEGEAPAVKILEGVLVKNINHVEVEALPKDLPREIKVDISVLDSFDKQIRAKDLKLPQGVKIDLGLEEMIVSVVPPRKEEEIKPVEEKPAEVVEPELAGEKSAEKSAEKPND